MQTAAPAMASATASLLTRRGPSLTTARRLTHTAASASATVLRVREVSGSHEITIDGFEPSKSIARGWCWVSRPFDVCGHAWRINYYPHGSKACVGRHVSLFLELDPAAQASGVNFTISLLDPESGKPAYTSAAGPLFFCAPSSSAHGFDEFISWRELEDSGCLDDGDRFTIRCDITSPAVCSDGPPPPPPPPAAAAEEVSAAPEPVTVAAVPPSDLQQQLTRLLWEDKRGNDVTVHVGGEATFDAHGWLLAARSPVLEAELNSGGSKKEKSHRRIEIQGVEPKVFEAMLHYMYTDALPDEMKEEEGGSMLAMAQGLLAAAHRFKIERLRLMCEETLAKRIDVSTVAGTLAVAEQHECGALKAACMEFMARPGNLKAVMETEGYGKIIKDQNCTGIMLDFAMRQLARGY